MEKSFESLEQIIADDMEENGDFQLRNKFTLKKCSV